MKTDNPGAISITVPIFSHAKSYINVSTENQELNKVEVRYDVDAAPIFSQAKSCINMSTATQGLNKEVVRYDVDSLEAI